MREGLLIIISGPSGVGKSTVCKQILSKRDCIKLSLSTTTRPPRAGEKVGREYFFTDRLSFKEMIEQNVFLEWAFVHNHYYGTRRDLVQETLRDGTDLILEIDVQGAAQVRSKEPSAVSIFIAPPSMETLRERITTRGTEDNDLINERLLTARLEMEAYNLYDYLVVNNTVEGAASLIGSIIEAEKSRISRGVHPPGWGGER